MENAFVLEQAYYMVVNLATIQQQIKFKNVERKQKDKNDVRRRENQMIMVGNWAIKSTIDDYRGGGSRENAVILGRACYTVIDLATIRHQSVTNWPAAMATSSSPAIDILH